MEATENKKGSGGAFIIQNHLNQEIFTPEDLNEEQQMMKAAVKEFIDREVWPQKERFEKKDYGLTKSLMEQAGSLGFLSVSVPEAYGGLGMGFVSSMLVCSSVPYRVIGRVPIPVWAPKAVENEPVAPEI